MLIPLLAMLGWAVLMVVQIANVIIHDDYYSFYSVRESCLNRHISDIGAAIIQSFLNRRIYQEHGLNEEFFIKHAANIYWDYQYYITSDSIDDFRQKYKNYE